VKEVATVLPEAKVRPRPRKWQPDCIQAKNKKSTALEAALIRR
jgi:hypothetical protein